MNKQHCEMLYRLLYFDIKFINFELNILLCFGELNLTFIQQLQTAKADFNRIQETFDTIGVTLKQPHNSPEKLDNIAKDLKATLGYTYRYHRRIWGDLLKFINISQSKIPRLNEVNSLLSKADRAMDHIVMITNLKGLPSSEQGRNFASGLPETTSQITSIITDIKRSEL
ncbi:unnamed protein product, partial [marine sediment metagenome]